jgi:hypothetical protein
MPDDAFQIRLGQVSTAEGGTELRVRDSSQASWRSWLKVGPEENLDALEFTKDGRSLIIQSSIGSDTARVVQRDLSNGAETLIAHSPEVDSSDVMIHPRTKVVEAVEFRSEDAPADGSVGELRLALGVELEQPHPTGLAVAVGIHGTAIDIDQRIGIERDSNAGAAWQSLLVKEGDCSAVSAEVASSEEGLTCKSGGEVRGPHHGVRRERLGKPEDGFARNRHGSFAVVRRHGIHDRQGRRVRGGHVGAAAVFLEVAPSVAVSIARRVCRIERVEESKAQFGHIINAIAIGIARLIERNPYDLIKRSRQQPRTRIDERSHPVRSETQIPGCHDALEALTLDEKVVKAFVRPVRDGKLALGVEADIKHLKFLPTGFESADPPQNHIDPGSQQQPMPSTVRKGKARCLPSHRFLFSSDLTTFSTSYDAAC